MLLLETLLDRERCERREWIKKQIVAQHRSWCFVRHMAKHTESIDHSNHCRHMPSI